MRVGNKVWEGWLLGLERVGIRVGAGAGEGWESGSLKGYCWSKGRVGVSRVIVTCCDSSRGVET